MGLNFFGGGSPRSQTWVFWVGKGGVVRRSLHIAQEMAGLTPCPSGIPLEGESPP